MDRGFEITSTCKNNALLTPVIRFCEISTEAPNKLSDRGGMRFEANRSMKKGGVANGN